MPEHSFTIMFDGKFQEGRPPEEVKAHLAKLFKASPEQIEQLCAKAPVVVKKGLDRQQALQYEHAFKRAGAFCRIVRDAGKNADAPPSIPQPAVSNSSPPKSQKKPVSRRSSEKTVPLAPKRQKTTLYHSIRSYQVTGGYQYLIWPIVKFKQISEAIFDTILTMIWNELMGAKYQPGQAGQIVAFLIFSSIAFAMPHIPDGAKDTALFVGILCWIGDRFLAQNGYLQTFKREKIFLSQKDDSQFLWKKIDATDEAFSIDIDRHSICGLSLRQEACFGGAFQEEIDPVWQLLLCLDDGADLLLDEREELMPLLRNAKKLAKELELPLKFSESEGENTLAEATPALARSTIEMSLKHFSPGQVGMTKDDEGIELFSRWNLKSVSRFLGTTIHDSGFLLFLLIMEGVLTRYGTLLNWLIGPYFGIHGTELVLDLSFRGILSVFSPDAGMLDLAETAGALSVMLYYGWTLSRPKRITIDKQTLRYFVGRRLKGELCASDLEPPLLLFDTEPYILLMDRQKALKIEQLQTENEYRALMINIQDALDSIKDEVKQEVGTQVEM